MAVLRSFIPAEDRYAACLAYGMVFCICFNGYDAGIMTVILADKQFTQYYNIDANKQGLVACIPWASTGLAQLFVGGYLSSCLGRLWTIRASILVICLGVIVQSIPNTFSVLILGRLMTGLGFGCICIAANLYVAECAPKNLRGSFVGTMSQFGYQLGTLIAFWTGYGMSYHTSPNNIAWRVSNLIQIPIGLTFIAFSFCFTERYGVTHTSSPVLTVNSPRWLLEAYPQQPQRALRSLAKIRSGDPFDARVQEEFCEMTAAHEYYMRFASGFTGIFKNPAMRKRLAFGFYATSLQQVGGIAALTMYAAIIYRALGWDNGNQALAINGVQSILQLLIVLVNTFTVDHFGRRQLLIVGFAIQALALLILSSLTTAFPVNTNQVAAIIEVAMLFIVGLTYCWSNGPIALTIASEIFPQQVRDKAFGLSLLGQTTCLLALTQPWPALNQTVGPKSYWLLFGLNLAAMVSVMVILPETKDVSLERMDMIFGSIDAVAEGKRETSASSAVGSETAQNYEQASKEARATVPEV